MGNLRDKKEEVYKPKAASKWRVVVFFLLFSIMIILVNSDCSRTIIFTFVLKIISSKSVPPKKFIRIRLSRLGPLLTKGYFSLNDFSAWAVCHRQNSKE